MGSTEPRHYAREARFAIGAFSADNMEIVQAIMVKALAAEVTVPVVLLLDHGGQLWDRHIPPMLRRSSGFATGGVA